MKTRISRNTPDLCSQSESDEIMVSEVIRLLGQIPSPMLGALVGVFTFLLFTLALAVITVLISDSACGRVVRVLNAIAKPGGKNERRRGKRK